MARDRGNRGGGRGGGQPSTPPPTPASSAPVPAPAGAATSVTPPAGEPLVSAPAPESRKEDLRGFEEGGGDLIPRKWVLLGMGAVILVAGLAMIPWGEIGGWIGARAGGIGESVSGPYAVLALGWVGILVAILWKKNYQGAAWLVLATGLVWYVATRPASPTPPPVVTPQKEECDKLVMMDRIIEVSIPKYGETEWIDLDMNIRRVEFDGGKKGFSLLVLGGKEGWRDFEPDDHEPVKLASHSLKFRRYPAENPGPVTVKICCWVKK